MLYQLSYTGTLLCAGAISTAHPQCVALICATGNLVQGKLVFLWRFGGSGSGSGRDSISGRSSAQGGRGAGRRGGRLQDSVSKLPQLSQTGCQPSWIAWHLSQTHCGPRGAAIARATRSRTIASSAPSPRAMAARIASERWVGARVATIVQRAAGAGEILGGHQKLGQQHLAFRRRPGGRWSGSGTASAARSGFPPARSRQRRRPGRGAAAPPRPSSAPGSRSCCRPSRYSRGQPWRRRGSGRATDGSPRSPLRAPRCWRRRRSRRAGLLQGQHGIAAAVDVLAAARRPSAWRPRVARAPGPIACVGLQFQQDILRFRMLGPQLEGLFGQLQRDFAVALGQLLLQKTAHADKAGGVVLAAASCRPRSRACGRQRPRRPGPPEASSVRACPSKRSAFWRAGQGQARLARGKRHHAFGQGSDSPCVRGCGRNSARSRFRRRSGNGTSRRAGPGPSSPARRPTNSTTPRTTAWTGPMVNSHPATVMRIASPVSDSNAGPKCQRGNHDDEEHNLCQRPEHHSPRAACRAAVAASVGLRLGDPGVKRGLHGWIERIEFRQRIGNAAVRTAQTRRARGSRPVCRRPAVSKTGPRSARRGNRRGGRPSRPRQKDRARYEGLRGQRRGKHLSRHASVGAPVSAIGPRASVRAGSASGLKLGCKGLARSDGRRQFIKCHGACWRPWLRLRPRPRGRWRWPRPL